MQNSPTPEAGWRWAPAWILACVALWPAAGVAEALLTLGALAAIALLAARRFRGGSALLSSQAWALTSVLFCAYWLPQLLSAVDAIDRARALKEALVDLRYLPFLWLVAMAVAGERGRRITFDGLGLIAGIWAIDALLQGVTGGSPLFALLDGAKHAVSGHGMCAPDRIDLVNDRVSGVLGPCNMKLGPVLASLSPFALQAATRRFGAAGWIAVATLVGFAVLLAGSRASWITYALVLLVSGWRLLGARNAAGALVAAVLALAATSALSPQVRERVARTLHPVAAQQPDLDTVLSGRERIWSAATCMIRQHPVNGVGVRGFRDAFPACDPAPSERPAWGTGPALHAHQVVLEILSETGAIGLLLWLAGVALAWRAWRYADAAARERAFPALLALAVTVFPLNTHLAFYSTFWGGMLLLLSALYAGSLLARPVPAAAERRE